MTTIGEKLKTVTSAKDEAGKTAAAEALMSSFGKSLITTGDKRIRFSDIVDAKGKLTPLATELGITDKQAEILKIVAQETGGGSKADNKNRTLYLSVNDFAKAKLSPEQITVLSPPVAEKNLNGDDLKKELIAQGATSDVAAAIVEKNKKDGLAKGDYKTLIAETKTKLETETKSAADQKVIDSALEGKSDAIAKTVRANVTEELKKNPAMKEADLKTLLANQIKAAETPKTPKKEGKEEEPKTTYKTKSADFLTAKGAYEVLKESGLLEKPGFFREMLTVGRAKSDTLFGRDNSEEAVTAALLANKNIAVEKETIVKKDGKDVVVKKTVIDPQGLANFINEKLVDLKRKDGEPDITDRKDFLKLSNMAKGDEKPKFEISAADILAKSDAILADASKDWQKDHKFKDAKDEYVVDNNKKLQKDHRITLDVVTETVVEQVKAPKPKAPNTADTPKITIDVKPSNDEPVEGTKQEFVARMDQKKRP